MQVGFSEEYCNIVIISLSNEKGLGETSGCGEKQHHCT